MTKGKFRKRDIRRAWTSDRNLDEMLSEDSGGFSRLMAASIVLSRLEGHPFVVKRDDSGRFSKLWITSIVNGRNVTWDYIVTKSGKGEPDKIYPIPFDSVKTLRDWINDMCRKHDKEFKKCNSW